MEVGEAEQRQGYLGFVRFVSKEWSKLWEVANDDDDDNDADVTNERFISKMAF